MQIQLNQRLPYKPSLEVVVVCADGMLADQGLDYPPYAEPKSSLLGNIATAVDKENFLQMKKVLEKKDHHKWDEELKKMEKMRDQIYEKVKDFTVFQAYTLIRTIEIAFENARDSAITIEQLLSLFSPRGGKDYQ